MTKISARIVIPLEVNFSDLRLSRDPGTGDMEFGPGRA